MRLSRAEACGCSAPSLPLPVRADEAKALGLAFVHQNLALIPTLSLTENMRLTHFATAPDWRISWRREHDSVAETLARYGLRLNPRAPGFEPLLGGAGAVRHRSRGRGSWARGDSAGRSRLLVLDEPTPFLPRVGVDQLFALVRRIVSEGASVIFVSHDIAEVMEITDRATILRDGAAGGRARHAVRLARGFRRADRRPLGHSLSRSQARRRETRRPSRASATSSRRASARSASRSARAKSSA